MLFKVLDENGRSCNGGTAQWSLPTRNDSGTWTPGAWMPAIDGDLVACENGYHVAENEQVLEWLGPRLFEAECRGDMLSESDKLVVRECRLLREFNGWNERTARLFAVWCARRVLALVANPDPRSIAACDVAERYANGQATSDELCAAWDAARDAAWDAAGAAARAAAWDAAGAAAGAAAWVAAMAAAWDAARYAVKDAQYQQLMAMIAVAGGE